MCYMHTIFYLLVIQPNYTHLFAWSRADIDYGSNYWYWLKMFNVMTYIKQYIHIYEYAWMFLFPETPKYIYIIHFSVPTTASFMSSRCIIIQYCHVFAMNIYHMWLLIILGPLNNWYAGSVMIIRGLTLRRVIDFHYDTHTNTAHILQEAISCNINQLKRAMISNNR